MPDSRAELELILKGALKAAKDMGVLADETKELEVALDKLEKQDLDLGTENLRKTQKALEETVRDTKDLIKEGDRLEKEFTRALRALDKASKRIDFDPASKTAQRLRVEVDRAGRALLEFGSKTPKALNATEKELKDVERAAKRARQEFGRFAKSAKPSRIGQLAASFTQLKAAVAAVIFGTIVRQLSELTANAVKAAVSVTRLANALDAIEGVDADKVLERVRGRAFALGVGLVDLEKQTTSFINAGLRLNLSLEQAQLIIEGFSVAAVGAGKSQEELNRALRQVEQGLAKNKFELQDLKIIMEVIPGVADALARGFEITTEKLFELQRKGLIPAKEATLVLAAELPKLFSKALIKNAEDFQAQVVRLGNSLSEAGRSLAKDMLPEMEEWLRLLGLVGSEGPADVSAVAKALTFVSDTLQAFVRNWKNRLLVAAVEFEDFALRVIKRAVAISGILEGLGGDIVPGFSKGVAAARKLLAEWEEDAKKRADSVKKSIADSFKDGDDLAQESADRRRKIFEKEQKEREAEAAKALARFKAGLKDREDAEIESFARRTDQFNKFFADTQAPSAGDQIATTTFQVSGTALAAAELERIAELIRIIQKLTTEGGLGIGSPEDLAALKAASDELFRLQSGGTAAATALQGVGGAVATVGDSTDRARQKLTELADTITASGDRVAILRDKIATLNALETLGTKQQADLQAFRKELAATETAFDRLGPAAQRNVGLIVQELERLVERGGVQDFELNDLLDQLKVKLDESGTAAQSAGQRIADYTNKQQQAGQGAQEAAEQIQKLVDETGRVTFTNLGEEAKAAAGDLSILEDAGKKGETVLTNLDLSLENAAEGIKVLRDEAGKVTEISNVGEVSKEAAEGAGELAKEAAPAARETEKLGTGLGEVSEEAPGAAAGTRDMGLAAGEAAPSILEASQAVGAFEDETGELVTNLAAIQAGLPIIQQAVTDLFAKLQEAVSTGTFTSIKDNLVAIIEAAESEDLEKLKTTLEALLKVAEDEEKISKLADAVAKFGEEEVVSSLKAANTEIEALGTGLETAAEKAEELAGDDGPIKKMLGLFEDLVKSIKDEVLPALGELSGEDGFGKVEAALDSLRDKMRDHIENLIPRYIEAWRRGLGLIVGDLDGLLGKLKEFDDALAKSREEAAKQIGSSGGSFQLPGGGGGGPVRGGGFS